MLEPSDAVALASDPWDEADACVELSATELHEFLGQSGAAQLMSDDRRRRRRYYFRCRALLRLSRSKAPTLGVYCRDISQVGIAVIAPRQLLPREQGLLITEARSFDIRVRHCQRLNSQCYLLGCDFDSEPKGGPLRAYDLNGI